MHFHPIIFELPKIDVTHFTSIRQSANRLKKRAVSIKKRSPKLDGAIRKIKAHVEGSDRKNIANQITTPLDARAFAYLFAHDELASKLIIAEDTLRAIDGAGAVIKRQTLMLLIEGYLFRYDSELGPETLLNLGLFIQQKLALFEGETRRSALNLLAKNRTRIFKSSGPEAVVSWSWKQSLELEESFDRLGLEAYCNGQYFLVCRYLYYLQELKSIPVGTYHKVLDEVTNSTVYMAPGKEMPLMGHDAISILIDRAKGDELSDEWMRVILDIAGDPRVAENSPNYQRWWSYLGLERIQIMRGWLSRLDLKLFLKVLDDFGKSSGDTDLKRMYPSRKRFLEGLIDHGLVTHSRLFINPRAEQFLKKGYNKEDLPEYARMSDTYRSMIYLKVGHVHLIEGSHSFKLWIFPKLPEATNILSYQHKLFSAPSLSSVLKGQYDNEFGYGAAPPAEIVHQPKNFFWQHQAINRLKGFGIKLDVEKLFSKQDYTKYIRIHGL
jgi:hypothetical protein